MSPEFFETFAQMRERAAHVRALYEGLDIHVNPTSDLGRYLLDIEGTTDLDDEPGTEHPTSRLVKIARALRVMTAILAAKNNVQAREPLKRIAKKRLSINEVGRAAGADALWELDFLLYAQRRGLTAIVAEPDVQLAMPFGTYGVACKNVHSKKKITELLRAGSDQVSRAGAGCVALNFDAHVGIDEPIVKPTPQEVSAEILRRMDTLLESVRKDIRDEVRSGRIDGVIVSMTCVAKVAVSGSTIDSFTQIKFWTGRHKPSPEAAYRFNVLQMRMTGPLSTYAL